MLRSQPKRPRCRSRRHWFPLPSTGRGIEGGLRVRGGHIQSRNSGLIARLSPWVARATGPYRPATRRTERVRRSFSQRTPFVIGALSFFRHLTFVIRHSQTETIKNPRNITFLQMKPHPTITQRNVANPWVVGRVTPCAPLLTFKSPSHPSCRLPTAALLLRNSICKYLFLQYVTPLPTSPIQLAVSPLTSLSPQRGEGLRVRGGHIQSRLPSVSSCISPIRGPG